MGMRSKDYHLIRKFEKGCISKRYFPTETEARRFVLNGYDLKLFKWEMSTYKCKFCDGYHISTSK